MINAIAKVAYSTGNKAMKLAEWLTEPMKGRSSCKYARIQRLWNSMPRIKWSAVKGQIIMSFLAMSSVAMQLAARVHSKREVRFDMDSHSVGIDNKCSKCISPDPLNFIGKVQDSNSMITRFGGSRVQTMKKGTLWWYWEDDTGPVHQFDIPDSYYVLNAKKWLFSPQHVVQVIQKKNSAWGLVCENDANVAQLQWNNGENVWTVPINLHNKCFTFWLALRFKYFMAYYCAEFNLNTASNTDEWYCLVAHL